MSDKRLAIIIIAIQKYINNYYNKELVDYYDIFGINRNMSSNEIIKYLKDNKYKACFHPDNMESLPDAYKEYYSDVVRFYTLFEDIITDNRKRSEYDAKLLKKTSHNDEHKQEEKKNDEDNEYIKQQKEIIYNGFSKYILPTIYKYGLFIAIHNTSDYMVNDHFDYKNFTRDDNSRYYLEFVDKKLYALKIQEVYGKNDRAAIEEMLNDALEIAALEMKNKYLEIYKNSNNKSYLCSAFKMASKISDEILRKNSYLMNYAINKEGVFINYPYLLMDFELEELINDYVNKVLLEEEQKHHR